jgi:tetratricopeptide (TPR) repeat protein
VAAAGRAFEQAVRVRGFVGYHEAWGWARGVNDAIDSIDRLLEAGRAAEVIGLSESGLQSLSKTIESVDDSDGHFGGLRDRLQDLHYQACLEAGPEPVDLAKRLFRYELDGEFDVFYEAVERYAKILGKEGMKAYRKVAEAEWAKVPERTEEEDHHASFRHNRVARMMETLARVSGDVEGQVAVMSRDLSSAYQYWRIAGVYREAGQSDQALSWAEKGIKAFPTHTDPRLREFAAEEYHRRRRHEDALNLMWPEFAERPYLEKYQALEKHAKRAGTWPEWRERALAEIRARIAKAKEKARGQVRDRWMPVEVDHSVIVEIFLSEGSVEDAWQEALAGGCSDHLWLRLAALREDEHPEDAASIYRMHAESAIDATSGGRYEEPVKFLIKAAAAMQRAGQSVEFTAQLEALQTKFKLKRNFLKRVEEKRKSLYLS